MGSTGIRRHKKSRRGLAARKPGAQRRMQDAGDRIGVRPAVSGVAAYYRTLEEIFALESKVLSGALPHYGERGANDEERVRDFLMKVLPRKFSVGTGFIACSDPALPVSSQTDVVIYDEIHNSPLHRELSAFVFPIEMVYGAVEVKGTLRPRDLAKIMADIRKVRELAKHRWYIEYVPIPKDPARPDELVIGRVETNSTKAPPRTFVFAFGADGWQDIRALVQSLTRAAKRVPSHIHGLVVLDRGWYVAQEAYAGDEARFQTFTDNALLRFVTGMMHSISSVRMAQTSIDRYMAPVHT
jgi:hypothetical protein